MNLNDHWAIDDFPYKVNTPVSVQSNIKAGYILKVETRTGRSLVP